MTRPELYDFLSRRRLGVLATIGPSGEPQSALMGIAVTPELEIIFDTVKTSRKHPNLVANPICSFVIGWESEQTVQYEGRARQPTPSQIERYKNLYFRVWPDGPNRESWPGIIYYVVEPSWIRYSDFARNPPLIEEWGLDQGRLSRCSV